VGLLGNGNEQLGSSMRWPLNSARLLLLLLPLANPKANPKGVGKRRAMVNLVNSSSEILPLLTTLPLQLVVEQGSGQRHSQSSTVFDLNLPPMLNLGCP
jgi:hypothetical protein